MELDARTLVIAVTIITVLQVGVVLIYYQMNRENRGVRWWLWGSVLFSAGFLALLVRDVPQLYQPSLVISNILILLGFCGHYVAITRFLGKKEDLRLLVPVPILTAAMLSFFTYAVDDFTARTVTIALAISFISVLAIIRLLRDRPPAISFSCNAMAAIYASQAVLFPLRAGLLLLYPVNDLFAGNLVQISLFLYMLAASFLFSFGFIIMMNQGLVEEVRKVKDRFELIFNTGPDMAFITRMDDDTVVQANDRFLELCSAGVGVPVVDAVKGLRADDGTRERTLRTLREQGRADNVEVEMTLEGGSKFVATVSARRFSDQGTEYAINVMRDITARKAAEERMRESEGKYRLLVEKASEAVVVAQDERLKLVNPAMAELTGISEKEMLGRPFIDLVHPDDRGLIMENYRRRFRQEDVPERYDFRVLRSNGEVRWAEVSAILIAWEGRPATLNFLTDITDRKQAEQALQEANRKLNLLSGITRHDISNQLVALSGRMELLEAKISEPQALEQIAKAKSAAERIYRMVQFTKEYENVGVNTPAWHNLARLVDAEAGDLPPGRVRLVNDIPRDLEMFADPLVSKVFHNLISNAVRHGGDLTEVRFFTEERNGVQVVICQDDGVGIPDEFRGRLFNRGVGKDHGFGLFLSREILMITGITIQDEVGMARGARFVIAPPAGGLRQDRGQAV